jgi:hypothetical protein
MYLRVGSFELPAELSRTEDARPAGANSAHAGEGSSWFSAFTADCRAYPANPGNSFSTNPFAEIAVTPEDTSRIFACAIAHDPVTLAGMLARHRGKTSG